jgi:hypothetical protein
MRLYDHYHAVMLTARPALVMAGCERRGGLDVDVSVDLTVLATVYCACTIDLYHSSVFFLVAFNSGVN